MPATVQMGKIKFVSFRDGVLNAEVMEILSILWAN